MDGFLVQQPFADLLASGKKTWELRTQPVHLPRKPFYILATKRPHPIAPSYDPARLGVVVGIAESDDVLGPFSVEELVKHQDKHNTPLEAVRTYAKGRKLYAMRFVHARTVPVRPYRSKPGPVTIVSNVELL